MAGTGVGKFSSTAGSNTSNMTVNFAENMAPSNVNNAARELMGHMRDMYEQLGDGYFEFGDGDGTYTIARVDADTLTIASASDLSAAYFAGRKIRVTDGGANVVEGTIASTSHGSSLQTVNLTGISLASGTPTKVELGIDTAAFGGKIILDDDGDTYLEAPTDDTIDIYVAGAKDFVITANTLTAESGSTIAAQAVTATSLDTAGGDITSGGVIKIDVDSDADDLTGDSATGRLTIGAGEDLNLYHGGTNSYIVNDTGDLIIDTAGDIQFDAAGNDFKFLASGTEILNITNSSSDVIIKPIADTKDLIFQQRDGTEVFRVEDGAYAAFKQATIPQVTVSSSSNAVAWNALTSPNIQHTTSENTTIGAPSGGVSGQFISILIIFGGTHTIGWNTVFEFADSTEPTETSVNNKADLHVFRYNGTMWHEVGRNQNMAIS